MVRNSFLVPNRFLESAILFEFNENLKTLLDTSENHCFSRQAFCSRNGWPLAVAQGNPFFHRSA